MSEGVEITVEMVDGPALVVAFDRKVDALLMPHQEAQQLADEFKRIAKEAKPYFKPSPRGTIIREQMQVQVKREGAKVAVLVDHTDRLTFTSLEAFSLLWRAVALFAQDARLYGDGVVMVYGADGLSSIHDLKRDTVQKL